MKDVLVPVGCGITGALIIVILAYVWRTYCCRKARSQHVPMVGTKVRVHFVTFLVYQYVFRGFAKLTKFQNKTSSPTNPPSIQFFLETHH